MKSKIRSSKFRVDRLTGVNIFSTAKSPVHTRNYRPGQHGNRRRVSSEYGKRLIEVGKLKQFYGDLKFNYLKRVFKEAANKKSGAGISHRTDDHLISILESRLSTVVYRAKLANSPFAARQLVSHKHILVNGKAVNINSYRVSVGDVIELCETMKNNPHVLESIKSNERNIPNNITMNSPTKFTIMAESTTANSSFGFALNLQSIVELMSRYI